MTAPPKKKAKKRRRKYRTPSRGTGPGAVPADAMERYLEAIRAQVSPSVASVYLGVSDSTVYRWLQVGEEAKSGAQREFWEATTRARAEGLAEVALKLKWHASGDYRAAETILRRRDPDNWGDPGKRMKLEHERALHAEELRKARAIADVAEAKARIAEAASKGEARGVVLSPVDLLSLLEGEVRAQVAAVLEQHGLVLRVLQHLLADVDEAEMMEATGLSHGGALPLME